MTIALLVAVALGIGASRPVRMHRPAAVDQLFVDGSFVLVVLSLALLLGVAVFALWPRGTDDVEERAKRSRLVMVVVVLLIVGFFLLLRSRHSADSAAKLFTPAAPPTTVRGTEVSTDTVRPRWAGVTAVSVVLLGGGAALVVLAVARGRRRRAGLPTDDDVATEPLGLLALVSVDALDAEPDDRLAVLAAYAAMEQVLGAQGLARWSWETPHEHVQRALADLGASAPVVGALTDLFAVARYSTMPLPLDARAEARRRLVELTLQFA